MPQNTSLSLKKEWTQIIPNSQLVVIPYPEEQPYYWVLHLFATPSRTIYITGAVLIGTCGFVAGIVGILHLRDRREDKLEKQQESQKFHFDAMWCDYCQTTKWETNTSSLSCLFVWCKINIMLTCLMLCMYGKLLYFIAHFLSDINAI